LRDGNAIGMWNGVEIPNNAAFSATPNHPTTPYKVLRDRCSLRFELKPGWVHVNPTTGYTAPRCEVYSIPDPAVYILEGETWKFEWSLYLPTGFPTSSGGAHWTSFLQWHNREGGSPPLFLVNEGSADELKLKNSKSGHTYWRAPMSQFVGRWTDFSMTVKFQRYAAQASVVLSVDGLQVASSTGQTYTQTPDGSGRSYPKVGLYGSAMQSTRISYVNGYRMTQL
jgi:hypothetical protein